MREDTGRSITRKLAVVSLAYLATQLIVVPLGRWWSWDEAISVSQVTRRVVAADFDPWRFRGVSFLVAPPALLDAPSTVTRVWLATVTALALFAVFRIWVPVLGSAAVTAAVVFGGSWLALVYGSEAMPNLWSAFCCIAAVGGAARREENSRVLTGGAILAMALFRLPDALILAVVLSGAAVIARRPPREYMAPLLAATAGGLIWALDAGIRFGLPGAVRTAIESQRSERLVTVTGPARRLFALFGWIGTNVPPTGFQPARWSIIWWVLVVAVAVFAAWRHTGAVRVAVVAGATLTVVYGVLVGPIVPRYLLPSLGLLAIGAAMGLSDLAAWAHHLRGDLVRGVATALALGLLLANVVGARQAVEDVVELRAIDRTVGDFVTRVLGDPPPGSCTLLVVGNAPAVGIATPCRTRFFYPPGDAYRGQSAAYLRQAIAVMEAGGDAYIVRIWPGPPPQGVTLEPVDGSDLATLYRMSPPGD